MPIFSDIARRLHFVSSYDPSLIIRDVAYLSGSDAHVNHKLDIFLPSSSKSLLASSEEASQESTKKIPIVIHFHGGGWVRGSRQNEWRGGPTVGRTCGKEGFIGVIASYRLARSSLLSFVTWSCIFGLLIFIISLLLFSWQLAASYIIFMSTIYAYNFLFKVRTPVNVEQMADDLCRVLVYVRDHIHEHCPLADSNQIFLSGHSAGAHLTSLIVLDRSHFERHNLSISMIRGVITISGIYTLSNPTHESRNHVRNLIFRVLYSSNLIFPEGKTKTEFSPIEHIHENSDLPPFLVMSARFDMGLEVDAKRFVEKFRKYNHQVDYYVIRGTTHGTIASRFANNDAHRHFFQFIRENIR